MWLGLTFQINKFKKDKEIGFSKKENFWFFLWSLKILLFIPIYFVISLPCWFFGLIAKLFESIYNMIEPLRISFGRFVIKDWTKKKYENHDIE
jgi:hypothetical protein